MALTDVDSTQAANMKADIQAEVGAARQTKNADGVGMTSISPNDKVGSEVYFDESGVDGNTLTPSKAALKLAEQQYYGGRGTTIYNLNPSHPYMEAVYGPLKYIAKIPADSRTAMRDELDKTANIIQDLNHKVEMLTMFIAAQGKGIPDVQASQEVPSFDLSELTITALRKRASIAGMPETASKSKEELIEFLS